MPNLLDRIRALIPGGNQRPEPISQDRLRLSAGVRAPKTIEAYAYDWKDYTGWCVKQGCKPLPSTAGQVADYITDCLNRQRKVTTVTRRLTAILYYHRTARVSPPAIDEAQTLIRGAKRIRKEQPAQREPLTIEHLRRLASLRAPGAIGARDWALLLVGFFSALRRSNLAALDMADVTISGKGIAIHVRSEKTDQEGVGRVLGIPPGKRAETCPVQALREWLIVRGNQPGPLFQRISNGRPNGRRLNPNRVSLVLKGQIAKLGLDPASFGAHSMRSGFVTEALEAGADPLLVARQTGHRSLATLKIYYRSRNPFAGNACARLDL